MLHVLSSRQNGCQSRDLLDLEACLALADSQLESWRRFAKQARVITGRYRLAMRLLQASMPGSAPAFPDQLELSLKWLNTKTDTLTELQLAARNLYTALTWRQRRHADRILARIFSEITKDDPLLQIAEPGHHCTTTEHRPDELALAH
jgi:hypothetical protein